MNTKKIYVIAGEPSGDLHGSNLVREILQLSEIQPQFRFWGGDLLEEVTHEKPVKHIKELAFMGFVEVVMNLKTILGNIRFCKEDITQFQPDVLILIDYPGFNLRIAEWAKSKGIKVVYYISPQIWAWKQNRVYKIKKSVDLMLTILPFEKAFYQKFETEVEYVGHPLVDAVKNYQLLPKENLREKYQLADKPILALLPGSRKQEISKKLPLMLKAAAAFEEYQVVIAGAPSTDASFYQQFLTDSHQLIFGETYTILENANLALVTSGTATLETALFRVPEVVCYIGNPISYVIARSLIKVKYISLVNLIMDDEVVKELIQGECSVQNMIAELKKLEENQIGRAELLTKYDELISLLGQGGASRNAAQKILNLLT